MVGALLVLWSSSVCDWLLNAAGVCLFVTLRNHRNMLFALCCVAFVAGSVDFVMCCLLYNLVLLCGRLVRVDC